MRLKTVVCILGSLVATLQADEKFNNNKTIAPNKSANMRLTADYFSTIKFGADADRNSSYKFETIGEWGAQMGYVNNEPNSGLLDWKNLTDVSGYKSRGPLVSDSSSSHSGRKFLSPWVRVKNRSNQNNYARTRITVTGRQGSHNKTTWTGSH